MADAPLIPQLGNECPEDKYLNRYVVKEVAAACADQHDIWWNLGIELLGRDGTTELNVIKANKTDDVTICCSKMLKLWRERQTEASWNQLVDALQQVKLNRIAKDIKRSLKSTTEHKYKLADTLQAMEITPIQQHDQAETKQRKSNEDAADMPVATEDDDLETLATFCTPDEGSVEFGILLFEIVEELQKNKAINLRKLKIMCSTLTLKKNPIIHVFSYNQMKKIQACKNIQALLTHELRHLYRWDDFSMLTKFLLSLKSKKCISLLEKYKVKIDSKMRLQQIYEHCNKQIGIKFSEEYHKVVAIVDEKSFSDITKNEYHVLKQFVSKNCGIEDYIISPFQKASTSSLLLEWYTPVTVVNHMIKTALSNKGNFTEYCFVYLKISSQVILDYRSTEMNRDQLFLAAEKGDIATIKVLLKVKGIDVNIMAPHDFKESQWNKTALHYGSEFGHVAVVKELIRAGADVCAIDFWGKTALHYGANNGHTEVVEGLIRVGADVNAVDDWGKTALHYGAKNAMWPVVEGLIRAGADVNAVDDNGKTPLQIATIDSDEKVIKLLKRLKIKIIKKNKKEGAGAYVSLDTNQAYSQMQAYNHSGRLQSTDQDVATESDEELCSPGYQSPEGATYRSLQSKQSKHSLHSLRSFHSGTSLVPVFM